MGCFLTIVTKSFPKNVILYFSAYFDREGFFINKETQERAGKSCGVENFSNSANKEGSLFIALIHSLSDIEFLFFKSSRAGLPFAISFQRRFLFESLHFFHGSFFKNISVKSLFAESKLFQSLKTKSFHISYLFAYLTSVGSASNILTQH